MSKESKKQREELIKKKESQSKLMRIVLIIILCLGAVYGAKVVLRSKQALKKSLHARNLGNPKADIHIVEHVCFQCPPCAQGYFFLKDYLKQYPEKMKIELRYHPWTRQRHALTSALYSECAAKQDKFWEYTQLLFEQQRIWKHELDAEMKFREIAHEAGLDEHELSKCVGLERTKKMILSEKEKGVSSGVNRTPTYFVNKKKVVGFDNLKRELMKYFNNIETPKDTALSDICDPEEDDICPG